MKRPFFRILVILMTFSIIGLVVVQLYWLNQAFRAGETEFNSRVIKAMDETVNLVNQNELNQYYELFNETRKTMKDSADAPQVITSQIESDSANVKYVYLTRYMMDKVALPVSGMYNDSLNVTELYSAERTIRLKKDSNIHHFQPIDVNLDSEFRDASYTLERFARFDAGNKPISKRINLNKLDSIFRIKLKKWNIDTSFELGILNKDSTTIAMKTKNFNLSRQNYLAPVFYNRDDTPSYYLSVLLPDKKKSIFSTLSALFGVTILFTLIILGIYAASIYFMLRQRQISQLKTDFMNNMTHEFKTPLATISVATDALKSRIVSQDAEKVKHYANLIKQENKRMNNQVEMVLRMSKLERNEIRLDPNVLHVNDLVRDSVDSIRLIVENRNGTIFESYKAQKDELSVDSFHLGNIILNVLDNANKYSENSPQISVETYNVNDTYVIKVSDEGIGMSKSVMSKIFEKFYREETGNIHNVKGHGLGLSYVKHIVELHGGEVDVESEKGKGSTFYIKLPLK
ncbi:MAG: HAMP domain-containing sensor histidine kinase [Flavobacteriaceae bacterium]|nr:HAMP domain-containing sensor histidine kinase [Flavobacteriaceae bacterium]